MTIRHLRIFSYVSETLNMTAAGAKLNMSQPSVSQAIKELEEYFDVVLFERFANSLYLTAAGERLRDYAMHIVSFFDEAERKIKNPDSSNQIRVGANLTIGTIMIHQYIKKFNRKYPHINVAVSVSNSVKIEEKLNRNELDLALMEETVRKNYLHTEIFCDDRIVIIAYPEHELCSKKDVSFEDITKEKILLREKGSGVRDKFDYLAYLREIKLNPLWESSSTTALVNAVKEKVGIAVVPYQLVKKELDSGTVKELKVMDMNLDRKLMIVTSKHKYITEPLKEFIDIVREVHTGFPISPTGKRGIK